MKRITFLFLFCSIVFSQLPVIPIDLDYACFNGTGRETYAEIYISFFQKDLHYQSHDNSTDIGRFSKEIKIYDNDSLVAKKERDYQSIVTKDEIRSGYDSFVDVFAFNIRPGLYTLQATIKDNAATKQGEFEMDIEIPEFSDKFDISNIELATKIERADKPSNFSGKNNIAIYPNPSQTFTVLNPILNFYFEAYNFILSNTGQNSYSYIYTIVDGENNLQRSDTSRVKSTSAKTIAEAKGINIITLPSGVYFLRIEITDHISDKKTAMQKRFSLFKPQKKHSEITQTGYKDDNYYINFTKEELQQEFEIAKYIATNNEVKVYKSLEDAVSLRRYLSSFWKKRDTDPTTPDNEYRKLYLERYALVQTKYKTPFREGWKTDQGRIVLIYGKPDEIERFQNTQNTQPYEIWNYFSLEGGVYFIFADMDGMGDIQLLHSTAKQEIKDSNWQMKINKVDSEVQFDGLNNDYGF